MPFTKILNNRCPHLRNQRQLNLKNSCSKADRNHPVWENLICAVVFIYFFFSFWETWNRLLRPFCYCGCEIVRNTNLIVCWLVVCQPFVFFKKMNHTFINYVRKNFLHLHQYATTKILKQERKRPRPWGFENAALRNFHIRHWEYN